jgi:hypothetical protein
MDKAIVRDIRQNRTYTRQVCHADTQYSGALGQGKKSNRHRKVWFEGSHEGIISDELFSACQELGATSGGKHAVPSRLNIYIMIDRVYCVRCAINRLSGLIDERYGSICISSEVGRETIFTIVLPREIK